MAINITVVRTVPGTAANPETQRWTFDINVVSGDDQLDFHWDGNDSTYVFGDSLQDLADALTGAGNASWANAGPANVYDMTWVANGPRAEMTTDNLTSVSNPGSWVNGNGIGSTITEQTAGSNGTQETQTATADTPAGSGTFDIGAQTDIAYNANAATVETAVEAHEGEGVAVSGSSLNAGFTIQWDAVGAQTALPFDGTNLTAGSTQAPRSMHQFRQRAA